MKVISVGEAMVIVAENPLRLYDYDYVMDEGGWLTPVEDFLDQLLGTHKGCEVSFDDYIMK